MDGNGCGRQGRSYDRTHTPSQIAAAATAPVDGAVGLCILLMRAADARYGRCPDLFRESRQHAAPLSASSFRSGISFAKTIPAFVWFLPGIPRAGFRLVPHVTVPSTTSSVSD